MAKDYAKFIPPKHRPLKKKSRGTDSFFVILVVLVIFAVGGALLVAKQSRVVAANPTGKTTFVSKVMALIQHKKPNIIATNKHAEKKVLAEVKTPPPVQFDFYSELPNMQVTLSEPSQAAKGIMDNRPIKDLAAAAAKPAMITQPISTTPETAKPNNIFTPSEVTGLIEAENNPQKFVIQLGAFETELGAHRLLEAIKSVGFEAKVIKTSHGSHTLFTVQEGPFDSLSIARTTQARMQKRGIVSVIRKTA